jgi:hypothetical protein
MRDHIIPCQSIKSIFFFLRKKERKTERKKKVPVDFKPEEGIYQK